MKKSFAAAALAFLLMLVLAACSSSGPSDDTESTDETEQPVQSFEFELKDDGTYKITGYYSNGNYPEIEIPAEYEGRAVTEIDRNVFAYKYFGEITIPASIKKIGTGAFSDVRIYTSDSSNYFRVYYDGTLEDWLQIEFAEGANPMTVSSINYDAVSLFYLKSGDDYEELTELSIPEGTQSIGPYQFASFNELTSITLPEGLTEIGESAFQFCTGVEELSLPDSLETIGMYAFSQFGVSGLTFTLPAGVRYIEPFAFQFSRFDELIFENSDDPWAAFSLRGCPADWKTVELEDSSYSYSFDSPEDNVDTLCNGTLSEYYLRRKS